MKSRRASLAVLLVVLVSGTAAAEDRGRFAKDVLGALDTEKQKRWKKIEWETEPDKALAKAKSENKPLLIFLHVKGAFNFDPSDDAC